MHRPMDLLLAIANQDESLIAKRDFDDLKDGFFDWLRSNEILVPASPAQHIYCPQCDDGHLVLVEPMIVRETKKFFYTCGETGTFEVDPSVLQRWRVNLNRMADVLAEILGMTSKAEVLVADRAWRLGTIVIGGDTFAMILFRGLGREDGSSIQAQATAAIPADRAIALMLDAQEEVTTTGESFASRLSLSTVVSCTSAGLIVDMDRIELSIPRLRAVLDKPVVNSETLTVSYKGRQCKFSARARALFALMERITRRPNHRVQFDTLRGPNGIYSEYETADQSIRTAATRLRSTLVKAKMDALANCIQTDSHEGGSITLNLSKYGAKSH